MWGCTCGGVQVWRLGVGMQVWRLGLGMQVWGFAMGVQFQKLGVGRNHPCLCRHKCYGSAGLLPPRQHVCVKSWGVPSTSIRVVLGCCPRGCSYLGVSEAASPLPHLTPLGPVQPLTLTD